METQVLEGTFSDIKRQFTELPLRPDELVRVVVSPKVLPETPSPTAAPFQPTQFRNGVPLLPNRQLDRPINVEFVKRLLDEEGV